MYGSLQCADYSNMFLTVCCSQNIVVHTAIRLRDEGPTNIGSIPGKDKKFYVIQNVRAHSRAHLVFCATRPSEIKRPEHEADHSPTSVEFKNEWGFSSTHPYAFMTSTKRTEALFMRNVTNQCIYRYVNLFYYKQRIACYVFRPPIMLIFRDVFFAGYIT